MSVVIKNNDLERKSQINSKFEIKNGLLGVQRDIFLLLLGYMCFESEEKKTRNVRILSFSFLFFILFYFF
jgi:hypothetical protein